MNTWFNKVSSKNEELLSDSINELSSVNLERYVYNVHRLNDASNYIFNSFENHLLNQSNYKSFEKFVRFVFENHSVDVQMNMLQSYFNKTMSFDWLFSSKKYVHKRVFNVLNEEYLNKYEGYSDNSGYLKNLLRIKRNDLYNSQKTNTLKFLENLVNPTKSHKRKTRQIKNNI